MNKRIYAPQIRKAMHNVDVSNLCEEDKDVIKSILYGTLKKIGIERFNKKQID